MRRIALLITSLTVKLTKSKKLTAYIFCLSSTGVDAAMTFQSRDALVELIPIGIKMWPFSESLAIVRHSYSTFKLVNAVSEALKLA